LTSFIDWYPEATECRYELRRGMIVEMPKPRGKHSEIAGFAHDELAINIRQQDYPYLIPRECLIEWSNWRVMKRWESPNIGFWIMPGRVQHLDKPKQPILTICTLLGANMSYSFRGGNRIISPTFPTLDLAAAQVLQTD
jgi:Uma2 family endonuclease